MQAAETAAARRVSNCLSKPIDLEAVFPVLSPKMAPCRAFVASHAYISVAGCSEYCPAQHEQWGGSGLQLAEQTQSIQEQ